MKLLIDLQGAQSESRDGGIGRLSQSLVKAIVMRGGDHDISILLNSSLRHKIDMLKAEFSSLLPRDRILTFQVPTPVAEHASGNIWRTRSAELIRETFIARHKPDVLFITSLFEGFVDDAVTSVGALDAPHLTAAMLYDLAPLLDPDKYLAAEARRRHYLRRAQALKRADLVLAISESSRGEALDLLNIEPERIAVIQCGVEKRFRERHLTPMQKEVLGLRYGIPRQFIFYVGSVDPRKNVDALLNGFAMLPTDVRSRHCLVFAGSIPEEQRRYVRALGARYGVSANELVFCGYVSDEDLVQLYNCCALFVFPSKHEGFGLPVLEALACGAPTLAADKTSLPEILGRADLLFDPDKAADLTVKMQLLLGDFNFRESVRDWGIKRAADFTWDNCASRALQNFEAIHELKNTNSSISKRSALQARKRLAFLAPLSSDDPNTSMHDSDVIRELARFYDIECIVKDPAVLDDWVTANFPARDVGWFERNAASYDRVVYSLGNSHSHAHMVGLLQRFPGVVLLHDFFLGDLIDWMCKTGLFPPDELFRELYRTHGLTGLLDGRKKGRASVIERFACNSIVFRHATGVIVHSQDAVDRACELFGKNVADEMIVIPHLRASSRGVSLVEARARLGLRPNDFVVCSLGTITKQKQGRELMEAWTTSAVGNQDNAVLIFVGDYSSSDYGRALEKAIKAHKGASRIAVTGYVLPGVYRDYLSASDLAVQLRIGSRGETSGAALDCLAAGIPVILNAHGTANELPDDVVHKLPEAFQISDLSGQIQRFYAKKDLGRDLGSKGLEHIARHHHPEVVGRAFHQAIESFAQNSSVAQQQTLITALSEIPVATWPTEDDLSQVAAVTAQNSFRPGLRQILCDVTVLADQDSKTGIQRVVRSILMTLVQSPPAGFRVEPIRIDGRGYRYARRFASEVLGIHSGGMPDTPVDFTRDDIYLAIDWVPDRLPQVTEWLKCFSDVGGKVVICIYDLLPLQIPQYFQDFMPTATQRWFEAALSVADQFVCISRAVADDVERFALALGAPGKRQLAVDYFHIGHDLAAGLPTRGLSANANQVLAQMGSRKSFLMVGTVEPRKGHLQVIQAFDVLWRSGVDVGLVIVGKKGWMVDAVAQFVVQHRERDRRLIWLQSASDEMLDKLYAEASALIAASIGEGFGLPLIEAANHKRPLIARDIPVFREVAGDHAFYFQGTEPESLSNAIQAWLKLDSTKQAPASEQMPRLNWQQSTDQLIEVVSSSKPYKVISIE